MEEASKCFQEKNQLIMSQCIPGASPQGGIVHPEGGVLPEGMDPATFEFPEGVELPAGGMPEGNPEGAVPEGYPQGSQPGGGPPDETGGFPSFSLDANMFANFSIVCEPGSLNELVNYTHGKFFPIKFLMLFWS